MASSLLSNLGQLHVVTGKITASAGTDAALTSNDGSASLTRNATGNFTVTFGQPFLSAPIVTASPVLTVTPTDGYGTDMIGVVVDAIATNSVELNVVDMSDATTNGDLSDAGTITFIAVGMRDN